MLSINMDYCYEDNDIQAILSSRVQQLYEQNPEHFVKTINVLAAVDNISKDQLKARLLADKSHSFGERISLIPCNLGNFHWTGIVLEFQSNGQIKRTEYIDSLALGIPEKFQTQFTEVYRDCNLQLRSFLTQADRTSCGAYAIENMLLSAQNLDQNDLAGIEIPSAKEIRGLHLECLEKYNPTFYSAFSIRQRDNLPSVSPIKDQPISNQKEINAESKKHTENSPGKVSEELDDLFKTLIILEDQITSLSSGKISKFFNNQSRQALRMMFDSVCNAEGKIALQIKDFKQIKENYSFLQVKPWEKDNKGTLWAYTSTTNATKVTGAVITAAPTLLSSAAGYYGAAEGLALAQAYEAGQAAESLLAALQAGSGALINPWTAIPATVSISAMWFAKRKSRAFSISIQNAIDLYNESIGKNDHSKIADVEGILRMEFGEGENGRYRLTRALRWLETSYNQFALAHLLRAEVGLQLLRLNVHADINLYYEFTKALSDARDTNIKAMGLLGLIKLLASDTVIKQNMPDDDGSIKSTEINENQRRKLLEDRAKEFNESYKGIVKEYFDYVCNTCAFIITHIDKEAILKRKSEIEMVLGFEDLHILRYMGKHGALSEILFTFLQAACFIMFKEHDIKINPKFAIEAPIKKHGAFTENQLKAIFLARKRLEECHNLIENLGLGREVHDLDKNGVTITEIKRFTLRFLKRHEHKVFTDNLTSIKANVSEGLEKDTTPVSAVSFVGVDDQIKKIENFFVQAKTNSTTKNHFLLLSGPPGVGKTELAKGLANRHGFIINEYKSGGNHDLFRAGLEIRVRKLFEESKKANAPTCILFDEMDAICPEFKGDISSYNPDEVVTLIQKEIDDLKGSKCVVIGATNYLLKIKSAIRNRAGTPIMFNLPTMAIRKKIIEDMLKTRKLEDASIVIRLAEATTGWSPRILTKYLRNVINTADNNHRFPAVATQDFIEEFEPMRQSLKDENKHIDIEPPSLKLGKPANSYAGLAGLDPNVERELEGVCSFLRRPELYRKRCNTITKNLLLYGPPGTGKTSFARAVANNACALFINIEAGKYTGYGSEKLLGEIFELAKRYEKAVIFIDEIDEIAQDRSIARASLQTAMAGFTKQENVLVVIGATNYLERIANPILSRFTSVEVVLPNEEQRAKVFKYCIGNVKSMELEKGLTDLALLIENCNIFAKESDGFSQRKINEVIEKSVERATHEEVKSGLSKSLTINDIYLEIQRIKKEITMQQNKKRLQFTL